MIVEFSKGDLIVLIEHCVEVPFLVVKPPEGGRRVLLKSCVDGRSSPAEVLSLSLRLYSRRAMHFPHNTQAASDARAQMDRKIMRFAPARRARGLQDYVDKYGTNYFHRFLTEAKSRRLRSGLSPCVKDEEGDRQ
ncbi:hypothetical protein SB748_26115 [Rhizobium sp. SIMBA_035]